MISYDIVAYIVRCRTISYDVVRCRTMSYDIVCIVRLSPQLPRCESSCATSLLRLATFAIRSDVPHYPGRSSTPHGAHPSPSTISYDIVRYIVRYRARYRTISYAVVRYRTISYDVARCPTISYDIVRCRTMSYSILYDLLRCRTISYDV